MMNTGGFDQAGLDMEDLGDPRRQEGLPGGYATQGQAVSAPYAEANIRAAENAIAVLSANRKINAPVPVKTAVKLPRMFDFIFSEIIPHNNPPKPVPIAKTVIAKAAVIGCNPLATNNAEI